MRIWFITRLFLREIAKNKFLRGFVFKAIQTTEEFFSFCIWTGIVTIFLNEWNRKHVGILTHRLANKPCGLKKSPHSIFPWKKKKKHRKKQTRRASFPTHSRKSPRVISLSILKTTLARNPLWCPLSFSSLSLRKRELARAPMHILYAYVPAVPHPRGSTLATFIPVHAS